MSANKVKKLLNFLLLLIFFAILAQFIFVSVRSLSIGDSQDFEVFYLSAQEVWIGENPYRKLGEDIVRNPPPALLLFTPLVLLPIGLSEIACFIFSFLAFLIGSHLLFQIIENQDKKNLLTSWQAKLIYLTLALRFFPLKHNLASGQVNSFLFLFLVSAYFFYLKKKDFLSALMFSLAIVLKITPIALILIPLIHKRFKNVLWILILIILASLLTTIAFSPQIWIHYTNITESYLNLNISNYYNQSLTGMLNRINPSMGRQFYIPIVTLLGLVLLYFKKFLTNESFVATTILWNLGILTILFLAPFTWQYHLLITIFPLLMTVFVSIKLKLKKTFWIPLLASYLLLAWNFKQPILLEKLDLTGNLLLSHAGFGLLILLAYNLKLATIRTKKTH